MQQEAIEVGKWFQQNHDKTLHGKLIVLDSYGGHEQIQH